jgi:hypothetical protein
MVTPEGSPSRWRRPVLWPAALREIGWPLAACAGLAVLLLHAAVLQGRHLYERDIHLVWWAQSAAFVRAALAGSWPVWDPSVCFGQPLLGDPSAQVLYPFTWLNLVLEPGPYYTLFAVTHLSLSGVGMFKLARAMGLGAPGALLAAGAWVASGPMLSVVNVYHLFVSAAWMPWVIWSAQASLASGRTAHAVRWGLIWALQILGGSAEVCAMTGLLLAALALTALTTAAGGVRARARLLGGAALAGAIAVGTTAAQWMPSLALVLRSARASLPGEMRTAWSVHPASLVEVLLPLGLNELPLAAPVRAVLFNSREPFLLSIYLGLPVIGWALVGLARSRWRWRGLLAIAAVGATLIALGAHTPLYGAVIALIPPLRILRYPSKVMLLAAFAAALLAGAGLDRWARPREEADPDAAPSPSAWPLWTAAASGAVGLLAVLLRPQALRALLFAAPADAAGDPLAAVSLRVGLAAAAALLVAVALTFTRSRNVSPRLTGTVVALSLLDLAATHLRLNPTASPELYRYRPPAAAVLRAEQATRVHVYEYDAPGAKGRAAVDHPDPEIAHRLREDLFVARLSGTPSLGVAEIQALAYQSYLLPPLPGRWGLRGAYDLDIRGLYPRPLARLGERLRAAEGTPAHARLLRLGGVSHVVSLHGWEDPRLVRVASVPGPLVPPVQVHRLVDPLPRAFLVGRARVVDDETALALLVDPAFDPSQEVLLPPASPVLAHAASGGSATVTAERPDRLQITTRSDAPAYLVLLDSFDPGWTVHLDGRPVPLLRANLAFRAVAVPAGEHRLEFLYRPRPLLAGLAVSALTLVAAAVVAHLTRAS